MGDATAIVTGGGGAIGGSAARHLAERGVRVLVVDVDGERAAQTVAEIERAGGTAAPHAADVSDADEVAGYVEACQGTFGPPSLFFNNAATEGAIAAIPTTRSTRSTARSRSTCAGCSSGCAA